MSQAQQAKFVTLFPPTTLNTGDRVNGRLDATDYAYAELILMVGDLGKEFTVGLWQGEDENGAPASPIDGATFTFSQGAEGKTGAFHIMQPCMTFATPLWLVIENTTGSQVTVAGLGRLTDGPMVDDLGLAKILYIQGDHMKAAGDG